MSEPQETQDDVARAPVTPSGAQGAVTAGVTGEQGGASRTARANEAAQSLAAILQTQYLRYVIIASWALALAAAVDVGLAAGWFALTLAAGAARGFVEKRVASRPGVAERKGFGLFFLVVATITTCAWAIAPAMAWFSDASFGRELAIGLLGAGYVLVFTQLRNTPRQAVVISSPYSLVALMIAVSLWGTPDFVAFLSLVPFTAAGLFVLVIMTLMKEERIRAFQAHQAHLIEELESARDTANAASEAKSNFLGVISHELRTPMNGVLGAAQLMSATRLDNTQREYLSIIRNSGDNLLSLLNDILDMTKIEAGKMSFETVDVDVQELHQRVIGPFMAQAQSKGLDFTHEMTGEVPATVRCDPLRVCQVLHNLLSNAVKFTEAGKVHYGVEATRIGEDRVRFRFAVTDQGPGIADEDRQRLFEPFTQLDATSTRRFGGTGLGLTISRRLARIMGGDIELETEPGKGSTFAFVVEAEVVEWAGHAAAEPVTADAEDAETLSVLVVEDHPVNRMIIEAWLTASGHESTSAEHGQIALELAATRRFDLIVMDVNMPVMDGLSATRALREGVNMNRDTPIVVLSASARSEDHEAGLEAGADAYLNKPIDFKLFAQIIQRVRGGREAVRASPATAAQAA
ncbi:MAG: ATP-binding protein [Brevundimonas sp.]|uniref:ATP-binding protein n=1 Tax=Brevundimonas sp. TaxID=1871086 RepID=UPI00391A109C